MKIRLTPRRSEVIIPREKRSYGVFLSIYPASSTRLIGMAISGCTSFL